MYYQYANEYNYQKGYFDFDTMGFGEVLHDEELLIEKIEELTTNGCKMDDKYKLRVKQFFKYSDKDNCKRVYEWILDN